MPAITPRTAASAIGVTVVVPTRGRRELLERCLDALTRQTLPGNCYEIIVVDDEPNHNTLHLVAGCRARTLERGPRLVYLPNANRHGPAAARNLGWRSAKAAIVAFTDEGAVPSPSWLAQGLAAFGTETDVLYGRLDTSPPGRPVKGDALRVANCFCRKTILEQLDGFDERFGKARHCDADLHFRLLALKARIARAPEALVVLPIGPTRWGASLGRTHSAVFDALLYKKHPQLYRQKIGAAPRWDYCAIVAALALALLGLAAGSPVLALAGFAAWAVMTALLCRKRLDGTSRSPSHIAEMVITSALVPPLAVFWRVAGAIRFRVRFA